MIKSFLTKILKICVFFCLAQTIVSNMIYQFVDVTSRTINPAFLAKLEYFQNKIQEYDSLFIGSSRTFQGIDTNKFYENTGLKAYNFGVPTFFIPKSIIILEELYPIIKNSKIKLIFLEITEITTNFDKYAVEQFYYNTKFKFDFETCLLKKPIKLGCFAQAANGALRKFFTSTKILFKKKVINKDWVKIISRNSGYQILKVKPNNPSQARLNFLKANRRIAIHEHQAEYKIKTKDHSFYSHLNKILQKYQDLGIEVILYNTPITSLRNIHSFFDNFIAENHYPFIEVSSTKYPILFNGELFFDDSHLNKNGGALFTDYLSESYLNLKKEGENNNAI